MYLAVVFCPRLHALTSNADLTPKNNITHLVNTVGVVVDVKCYSGYIQGTRSITCLISGIWDPQTPTCNGNSFAMSYLFMFNTHNVVFTPVKFCWTQTNYC